MPCRLTTPSLDCYSLNIAFYSNGCYDRILIKIEDIVDSQRAPEPVGLYPHARRVGNLLFLSGVGPRERGKKEIPGVTLDDAGKIVSYDIETQCRSVFQNVRYILEDAGSSWKNIFDVTVFLTNMSDDFPIYNRVYAEYFSENKPCRTTVEVNRLPTPIAIELKVIATID
jgi:Putative translation initiation inhibitor, yjgF family